MPGFYFANLKTSFKFQKMYSRHVCTKWTEYADEKPFPDSIPLKIAGILFEKISDK